MSEEAVYSCIFTQTIKFLKKSVAGIFGGAVELMPLF
jgi:hypothetical protein